MAEKFNDSQWRRDQIELSEEKVFEVDIAQKVEKDLDPLKTKLRSFGNATTDKGWKKGIDQILKALDKAQDIADKNGLTRGVLPY